MDVIGFPEASNPVLVIGITNGDEFPDSVIDWRVASEVGRRVVVKGWPD